MRRDCSLGANRRCSGKVSARIAGKLAEGGLRLTWLCLRGLLYPSLVRLLGTIFKKSHFVLGVAPLLAASRGGLRDAEAWLWTARSWGHSERDL